MRRFLVLLFAVALLTAIAGCQSSAPAVTTSTDSTTPTTPTETETAPPATNSPETIPPTDPSETIPPKPPTEEEVVKDLILTMITAHWENNHIFTEQPIEPYTILALNEEQAGRKVEYKGSEITISDLNDNIRFLLAKEDYWRYHRNGSIMEDFRVGIHFPEFTIEGDVLTLELYIGESFFYEGHAERSGGGGEYSISLIRVDGQWYICELLSNTQYLDLNYKNNPEFDLEVFIKENHDLYTSLKNGSDAPAE